MEFFAKPYIFEAFGHKYIGGVYPLQDFSENHFLTAQRLFEERFREEKTEHHFHLVTVKSNHDEHKSYVLKVYDSGELWCSCKGFQFRKTCKHIEEFKKDHNVKTNHS